MFEIELRLSTCKVSCGDLRGTGFLVGEDEVITARHCVLPAIENSVPVILEFHVPGTGKTAVTAEVVDHEPDIDVCLLRINENLGVRYHGFDIEHPRVGTEWRSFGFPNSKALHGHGISGKIEAVFDSPAAKIDLDLSVDVDLKLASYRGMSGSPIVVGNSIRGVLRVEMDNSLGAISTHAILPLLKRNGFKKSTRTPKDESGQDFAQRLEFQKHFESRILKEGRGFFFLEGAHGIGKSTFCQNLVTLSEEMLVIGAYCVRESSLSNTSVRSQPSQLFDWLVSAIATLLTGKPDRKEEVNYEEMASKLEMVLERCSEFCVDAGQTGVVFIDGINEVADIEQKRLSDFVGLLPSTLPANLAIVFSAPSFSSVSNRLGGRVANENVLTIPPLSDAVASGFVSRHLENRPGTSLALVDTIVQKAAGHPLYLNYLIRFVREQAGDDVLAEFPVLTGPIEDYYERIWSSVQGEACVSYLLGVIARLRDAIQIDEFVATLNDTEQAAFPVVLAKWGHLFRTKSSTEMFHESFRTFIQSKTEILKKTIDERLAKLCIVNSSMRYCRVNRVFHCLRASGETQEQCLPLCDQEWIDDCVLLSVEPDVLLEDLRDVVSFAFQRGQTTHAIRVLLLQQRVSFRYEILFAQSASEVAKALVVLNRPIDALNHLFRYEVLIVHPKEALAVAWLMIEREYFAEAVQVAKAVISLCVRVYGEPGLEVSAFVELAVCHIFAVMFLRVTGETGMGHVTHVISKCSQMLRLSLPEQEEIISQFTRQLVVAPQVYFFTFKHVYSSNDDLQALDNTEFIGNAEYIRHQLDIFADHVKTSDEFELPIASECIEKILADIEEGLNHASVVQYPEIERIVDALVRVNAPESIVAKLLGDSEEKLEADEFVIRSENSVDASLRDIYWQYVRWRVKAYLGDVEDLTSVVCIESQDWEARLRCALKQSALLDGAIRRARFAGNDALLNTLCGQVFSSLLPYLEFSLLERSKWDRAYAIPEAVIPLIATLILECLLDCSPESAVTFLEWVRARSAGQCGLYSEGFRELLFDVCKASRKSSTDEKVHASAFSVAQQLRSHVLECVQNRHELVPQLLRLVKLFSSLGAQKIAEQCYRDVLRFSMGPTWYKEEQFDLLASGLQQLPESAVDAVTIRRVETLLESASGEMTFQRYVRDAKARVIAILSRKEKLSEATNFLKSQLCGTTDELIAEASTSKVDRIDSLRGNRFPGGGVDDQQAILGLVEEATCDWRLKWAILEIFQIGDSRYCSRFGRQFATIVNEELAHSQAIEDMLHRFRMMITSDLTDATIPEFLEAFCDKVDDSVRQRFEAISPLTRSDGVDVDELSSSSGHSSESDARDAFYLPGFVGKKEGVQGFDGAIDQAKKQIALGNIEDARDALISVLRQAQDADWPIWEASGSAIDVALNVLIDTCDNAGEIVLVCHDLVMGERFVPSWFVANSLIEKCSGSVSRQESVDVMEVVIEHVEHLLGRGIHDNELSGSDTSVPELDCNVTLLSFIAWCFTHPRWTRRDKAAELIVWLFQSDGGFEQAIIAVLDGAGSIQKKIAFGLIAVKSRDSPLEAWDLLSSIYANDDVTIEQEDVCLLAFQFQIATNASEHGKSPASKLVNHIKSFVSSGTIELPYSPFVELPDWAKCLGKMVSNLNEFNCGDSAFVDALEDSMRELCSPHDIDTMYELEKLISQGFWESSHLPWSRWYSLSTAALGKVLSSRVTLEQLSWVSDVVSPINPSLPALDRIPGFNSPFKRFFDKMVIGQFGEIVQSDDRCILHYIEIGEAGNPQSEELSELGFHTIEITAFLSSTEVRSRGYFHPEATSVFPSGGLPSCEGGELEVCSIPRPRFIFGGAFTPAMPLSHFLSTAGLEPSDCVRENWRCGRSKRLESFGRPIYEGCRTTVSNQAIRLPSDLKLVWTFALNGQVIALIDAEGNELI